MRTTLLLNWYANPYHTPVFVAKALGYFEEEEIKLAILEPSDPSDVTEIVGRGLVDFGLKAMVHCYAARSRNYPIVSIGTVLDEPPTGLIFLKKSGIKRFEDVKGKRLGFVGEFGKVMIDDLAKRINLAPGEYETVRTGMNLTQALKNDEIDAGIGIGCFQQVEVDALVGEADILRIDELAGLGCCCFCSIMCITQEERVNQDPKKVEGFMRAMQRGMAFMYENPQEAYRIMCHQNPRLDTELYHKIYLSCLPYFSRHLVNVERDWNKVGTYAKQLGIVPEGYNPEECYTNKFVPVKTHARFEPLGCCAV